MSIAGEGMTTTGPRPLPPGLFPLPPWATLLGSPPPTQLGHKDSTSVLSILSICTLRWG